MLNEIVKNVKKKITHIARDLNEHITIPQQKYLQEMISGSLSTKSLNLTAISGYLDETIGIKHTLKRLQRNTENYSNFLEQANKYNIHKAYEETKTEDRVIISVDGGDIVHKYGKSFELISKVRDGSTKKIESGYWVNHAVCYSPSNKRLYPVYLDIYSTEEEDFKSANDETLKLLSALKVFFSDRSLFVFDRGYDSGVIVSYLLENTLSFVVRSVGSRHVRYKNDNVSVSYLCDKLINRRYKKKLFSFGYAKCYYKDKPITVVSVKGKYYKNTIYFLCEGHIRSSKEIFFRIKSYFKRWKVEESFRFMKQSMGIERCLVRKFKSIRTLLGIALFCWRVISMIESDILIARALENQAKREKYDKKDKVVCKFKGYRLMDGISNTLSAYNKKLFDFRTKKYISDRTQYVTSIYELLRKYENRDTIPGIPILKKKKYSLVA